MDTQSVQLQYWNEFTRLKRDAIYIGRYHARVEVVDRALSIITAIASSAAIAGWAIWHEAGFVWGFVIAISQVLTAIKPFLPYKARLEALAQFGAELNNLALIAESDWLAVSRLDIDDGEINRRTISLKKKALTAVGKSFKGASLPEKLSWVEDADRAAHDYMQSFILAATIQED